MQLPPLILVAHDGDELRKELCDLLARAELRAFPSPLDEGLPRLVNELNPDLVLLGLEAPEQKGVDLLRALKAGAGESFLPVVMVASTGDRTARLTALRLGADDVVLRPWDDEELVVRLQAMLRIKAQQDRIAARSCELERLSVTDELTGLFNRRHFRERMREEFLRAERYGQPLSLLILDLDHFKAINDRFGHLAGDEVLRQASRLLPDCVRDSDVVSRFGGEEFTILLPQTGLSGSLTAAERILSAVRSHRFAVGDGFERLTASIGVSSYPNRDVARAEDLLRTADQALYRAKRTGRDKISLHQPAGYFLPSDTPARRQAATRPPAN